MAVSAVLSLLCHHCYSWLKTKSKLRTPISTVVHAAVVCGPKILPIGFFSQPYLTIYDHCTLEHVSIPKLPTHFAGNERFLPEFPSSLLSGYALNTQTGHGRERDLGTRSIFSLPRVVRSINVQYLPHSTEKPRFDQIRESNVKLEKSYLS